MPFNKNQKALIPDWTQIEANTGYLNQRNGRYEMSYQSEFLSTGGADLDKRLEIATRKGISKLVKYYNKQFFDQNVFDRLVSDSLKNTKYFVDPRKVCSFMRVLVSIEYDELLALHASPKPAAEERRYLASFHVASMRKASRELSSFMRINGEVSEFSKFRPYVNNIRIDLTREADYFENLIDFLSSFSTEEDAVLSFLFDDKLRLLDVISDKEEIMRGRWASLPYKKFYNVVSVSYLINYFKIFRLTESGESVSTNKFLKSFIIGDILLKDESVQPKNRKYNLVDEAKNTVNNFYDEKKEKVLNDLKRFGKIDNPIEVNLKCGKIPVSQVNEEIGNIIYKVAQRKNIEDDILNNSIITAEYFDKNATLGDFVGDRAINDLLGLSGADGPANLKEFYSAVLNQIDVRTLTNKLMQCLFTGKEIQTVCVEFHNPLSFRLPDSLKIPSIFDFLSKLALKILLALVTEIIKWLMSLLINELNKCIRNKEQGFAALEEEKNISDYFGPNIPAVSDYINESITGLLDNDGLTNIVSGDRIHEFIKDIISLLTIVEFCQLVNGEASDDTLGLIRCLVETKYTEFMTALDNNHKIESVFSSLGSVINKDFCSSVIDSFADDDHKVCQPSNQQQALRRLLENKGDGITTEQIDDQIKQLEEIKKEQAEIYFGLLKNKGDLTEALLGGEAPEDFVKKLLPCAEENEPMAHMIRLSLESIIEPLRESLSQNMASTDFSFSTVAVLKTIEDEKFRNISNAFKDASRVFVSGEEINYGGLRLKFSDNEEDNTSTISANSSSGILDIVRDRAFTPDVTGDYRKDLFTKTLMDKLREKGVDLSTLDQRGFRNSISDVYLTMFMRMLWTYSSDIGDSYIRNKKDDLIESIEELFDEDKLEFFENMWRSAQEDLVNGVSGTFFKEECKSRDFKDLQKVIFEMVLYLYIRLHIFEFFFKSLYSITEYGSRDLNRNSIKDFISKGIKKDGIIDEAANFIKDIEDKRDLSFDDFVSEQLSDISTSLQNTGDINSVFKKIRNTSGNTASKILINNIRFMDVQYAENVPRFVLAQLIQNQQETRRLNYNLNSKISWNEDDFHVGQFFLERYIRVEEKGTNSPLQNRNTLLKGVVNLDRWQTYAGTFTDNSSHEDHFESLSYGFRLNILWPTLSSNLLKPIQYLQNMNEVSKLEKAFFIKELGKDFFVLPLIEIEQKIPNAATNSLLEWPEQRMIQSLLESPQWAELLGTLFPPEEMLALTTFRDYNNFNKNYFKSQRIFKEPLKILKFVMQGIINLEDFTCHNKELQTNSRLGKTR